MREVSLRINNNEITAKRGQTILEVARENNISIPTLCHHEDLGIKANCRICLVEDRNVMVPACATEVANDMDIQTNNKKVRDIRMGVLELILANHDQDCLKCPRNGSCELQSICETYDISRKDSPLVRTKDVTVDSPDIDSFNPSVVKDYSKCIKCNRCIDACSTIQNVNAISKAHRSIHYRVTPAYEKKLHETKCVFCGQCISVCPVGALHEKTEIDKVLDAIENRDLTVIAQIAPAIRVSLGELFGYDEGSLVLGKTVSALRALGFDKVFDTNFTADLTILEEGTELLNRIKTGGKLPMITSCSPGWINYLENFYGDIKEHVSTCKSPQQMFGALSKNYYPSKIGKHPREIFTVSIMPCTAKKYEAARDNMRSYGVRDVDAVLTTRELAKLIKMSGIEFTRLENGKFDEPFGISTGAAAIFGATGGVMEAALRSVYEIVTGKTLSSLNFSEVRGYDGIREATIDLEGTKVRVAMAHTLSKAKVLLDEIRDGKSPYTFIEIMTCPGGCIGGGGQPIAKSFATKIKRTEGIYRLDENLPVRKSHENEGVKALYEDYLGEPGSEIAHKILHTHYTLRV